MTLVRDILNPTQLNSLRILAEAAQIRDQEQPYALGNWSSVYRFLYDCITVTGVGGLLNEAPVAGVPQDVWLWLRGARFVNSGEGPSANLIKDYTAIQYRLRYGEPLDPGRLNKASNLIARNFISEWLKGDGATVPTIDQVRDFDAGPVAAEVFSNDVSGWAGVPLFIQLGDRTYFDALIISSMLNPYVPQRQNAATGAYNFAAMVQSIQDFSALHGFSALPNYFLETVGQLFETFPVSPSLKADLNSAFLGLYGLEVGESSIDPAKDALSYLSYFTPFEVGKSAHYATGTGGADVMGYKTAGNTSYLTDGVSFLIPGVPVPLGDFVHAGAGEDVVYGTGGNDILDGGDDHDELRYLPRSWRGVRDELRFSFDGKGRSPSRVVVEKPGPLLGDAFYNERDVAINFERLVVDFRANQVTSATQPSGRQEIVDLTNAPVISVDVSAEYDAGGVGTARSERVEISGDLTGMAGANVRIDLGSSPSVSSNQDVIDASGALGPVVIDLRDGRVRATATEGWQPFATKLYIENANKAVGTQFADELYGSSFKGRSGDINSNLGQLASDPGLEGFSVLIGGAGEDKLATAGYRTEMYGGADSDKFHVGAGGFIEDATAQDRVYASNLRLFGGIKPWWLKSNYALPMMFGGVASQFSVIGGSLLQAAATFLDEAYFSLAHFATGADGSLAIRFGFGGKWAQTIVRNYELDLDTGVGTAGLTVVSFTNVAARSREMFAKGVTFAMKAGFGRGLDGQDPIVLDLNGDGLKLWTATNSPVFFDFLGSGFGERTAWVRDGDGILARDLDSNGRIETLAEMFGAPGDAGFAALNAYDTNSDGRIDASDARASELRVWVDANGDGVTQGGELKTLADAGVQSISLSTTSSTDDRIAGSEVIARGTFVRRDGSTGESAEVLFAVDPIQTQYAGDRTISAEAALLPEHLGTGRVADLRVAATRDATLRALLTHFASAPATDLSTLAGRAEQIFLRWTSADSVTPAALGSFDTRKLAALEALAGRQLAPRENGVPTAVNDDELLSLWNDTLQRFTLRLLVQGPLANVFSGIQYIADRDLLLVDNSADLGSIFAAVLDGLPSDPAAAQSAWSEWASLLKPLLEDLSWRHESGPILVDAGFALAALQNALQNSSTSLTLAGLAPTLGYGNTLFGSNGNDVLTRAVSGIATFVSSGGADRFVGGNGQDFYLVGANAGQITIEDAENAESGDTLQFSTLRRQDVTAARDGQDLVLTSAVDNTVVRVVGQFADVQRGPGGLVQGVRRGVEAIMFADGVLLETGLGQISQLTGTGTAAAETISGTNRSDYLEGGAGDDTLRGGDDGDFYYYNAGDGNDVIQDVMTNPTVRATDMLMFGRNITPAEIAFGRIGASDDLVITIGAVGQQSTITIEGQFGYDVLGTDQPFSRNYAIESFVFEAFGETWSAADVQQLLIAQTSTDGDDTTFGYGSNNEFFATTGNDLLVGLDGDDRYHWSAGAGNDTIDERARYVDVEVGLGGINLGATADTVLLDGLDRADVRFSRISAAPDLTVTILATGETLTVKNQFAGFQTGPLGAQWMDRIEWFQFADGARLSWRDVLDDVTTGSAQDDLLWGDLSVDTLDGGAGNDRLSGRGYGDFYVFKLGYGHDTIVDDNTSFAAPGVLELDTTPDILTFGAGIDPSTITFARSGNDIDLIVNASDRVTLVGQVAYLNTGVFGILSVDRIEEFRFASGETWSWSDLNRRVILSQTTAGNDVVEGFVLADRFEASAGNDVLRGGDSGDTYVFGFGSGQDRIEETVGNVMYGDDDVVEFGPEVRPQDVSVGRTGDDLIFTLTTGDSLRIVNQFGYYTDYRWNDVESFRFADGTTWSEDDLKARLLAGTPGNDTIIGFSSPDTIRGGLGDDALQGGDGGDTYLFDIGDGQDVIRETVGFVAIGDDDRIRFGPGITLANLNFSRNGNDLTISIAGTSDQIRIEGQFSYYTNYVWNDVETLEFADGSTFTDAQIRARLTIGSAQAETITGFYSDDVLIGGAGDDVLRGGDGADTYRFDLGFGHDRVEESVGFVTISDFDTVEFGPGITPADLVVTRDLNDIVISAFGGSGSIRIVGQQASTSGFTWSDIERVRFADGTE
jgi:Ca2+-binding RTX toxin-like protein